MSLIEEAQQIHLNASEKLDETAHATVAVETLLDETAVMANDLISKMEAVIAAAVEAGFEGSAANATAVKEKIETTLHGHLGDAASRLQEVIQLIGGASETIVELGTEIAAISPS